MNPVRVLMTLRPFFEAISDCRSVVTKVLMRAAEASWGSLFNFLRVLIR